MFISTDFRDMEWGAADYLQQLLQLVWTYYSLLNVNTYSLTC